MLRWVMAGLWLALAFALPVGAAETAPPNFILIVGDDIGWRDVGYHGAEFATPAIDRLAREGAELARFYVWPTCSPTRSALLTGRPASRFGILGPIVGRTNLPNAEISTSLRKSLPHETPTLPALLRERGYRTHIAGKWHLGFSAKDGPRQFGFESSYGYFHGQLDPWNHLYKYGDRTWHRDDQLTTESGHVTDLITADALRFIDERAADGEPFFLYVAHASPHFPLDEPRWWLEQAEGIEQRSRRQFAAAMMHLDYSVGEIIERLERSGLARNTLVWFTSDNGGQRAWRAPDNEYEGRYEPDEVLGNNRPLRGWKGSVHEGGVRVPAAVWWPGRIEPRKVEAALCATDLMPTLARAAGLVPDQGLNIEGVDAWDVLAEGADPGERTIYIRTGRERALIRGEWKLIESDRAEPMLFNLAADPHEEQDIAASEPARLRELQAELARQRASDIDG